jgi:hypothetical protein
MSTANDIHREILRYKSELDSNVTMLETSQAEASVAIQQRIAFLLNKFSEDLDLLSELSRTDDPKSQSLWTTRISRLNGDLTTLRSVFDRRIGLLFRSQREQMQREYIFGNVKNTSPGSEREEVLKERSSLQSSHSMIDNITEQSRAILTGVLGQNVTLKNARGKLYDLLNNVGVGSSLASSIQSRERTDALLVYSCIILTLIVFFLLWWSFR